MKQVNKCFAVVVLTLLFVLNLNVIKTEAKMLPPDKMTKDVHYYIIKEPVAGKPGNVSAKLQNRTVAIKVPETVEIKGDTYVVTEVTGLCYPDTLDSSARTDAYKCKENRKTKEVILPKTVKNLEKGTFTNFTSLKKITVDEGNPKFKSTDGALFSKDGSILYGVPTVHGTYRIPEGVIVIASRTFAYSKAEKVILPQSCKRINERAFYMSKQLKKIKNLSNVKKIGANVFYGTSLKG